MVTLNQGIIEKVPEVATGERVFYLPHKPVCCENASITKTRMVFDCSADLLQCQKASMSVCTLALHCSQICGILWSGPEWHQTY